MAPRTSAEIRDAFLSFFEERDHRRVPSASLVPVLLRPVGAADDGRHAAVQALLPGPGGAAAPAPDLLPEVLPHDRHRPGRPDRAPPDLLRDARQLLVRRLLQAGRGRVRVGAVDARASGSTPSAIWITVFEGDEELGLGPDEEAIECWRVVGVPDERIVRLPRSENFWQAGPTGPCGPCSELYFDRGLDFGGADDRPGRRHRALPRVLEPRLHAVRAARGRLARAAAEAQHRHRARASTGMAAILQDVPSVFENDQFRPLVELGEELSGRRYGADPATTRALRVLADHGRAMTLPDRRRRRALERGPRLHPAPRHAPRDPAGPLDRARAAVPRPVRRPRDRDDGRRLPGAASASAATIHQWLAAEEESFGRTLEQGTRLLAELIERAQGRGHLVDRRGGRLPAARHLRLPLRPDARAAPGGGPVGRRRGLPRADGGAARARAHRRGAARTAPRASTSGASRSRGGAGFPTRFVGYETTEVRHERRRAASATNGRCSRSSPRAPFYAEGGGQVADAGVVESESGAARVEDVYRLGDDQAVAVAVEQRRAAARASGCGCVVDRQARHATACNHTATHLLHAALRAAARHARAPGRLGGAPGQAALRLHPRQAALAARSCATIEDQVNEWIAREPPGARAPHDAHARRGAGRDGAVRREVRRRGARGRGRGRLARALRRHARRRPRPRSASSRSSSEGSSAANVRRIEAVTGPGGGRACCASATRR